MENRWVLVVGSIVGVAAISVAWSAALTLLHTHSLRALNDMQPWGVYTFMWTYGVSGRAGTLLWNAWLLAVGTTGLLSIPFFFFRRPNWYGDARWARLGEIRKARLTAKAGLVLGKKTGKLLVNAEPIHTLVAAPTRSGKGVGIVIPNLLFWPDSVVVLDIKHENYAATAGYRGKVGHNRVFKWAPMEEQTHRYNPFDFISPHPAHRITDIQLLATILLPIAPRGEGMWVNEARNLFLGLALYVLDDPNSPATLGQIYRTLMREKDLAEIAGDMLEQTAMTLPTPARQALANFKNKADKERSAVKSTLTQALNLWANPIIDHATSASDFDLRTFRKLPSSVFVGVAQDQLVTLAPLLNMFFQQTVATLSHALPGKGETHEVLFMIDEFPMLGQMESLAKGLALLAGYKIRIVLITQGLGQLKDIYGPGGQESILQNCAVQVFFASNDDSTTNYISGRLGTKTVPVTSRSQAQDWKTTTSTNYVSRPLMAPEEVRRLPPTQAILFKEGSRPVLAQKIRYYADRPFTARLLDPPAVPALDRLEPDPESRAAAAQELADIMDLELPEEPAGGPADQEQPPTAAELEAIYRRFGESRAA